MGFDDVKRSLRRLEAARDKVALAQAAEKGFREELHESVLALGDELTEQLTRTLYWYYFDIKPTWLAEVLGVTPGVALTAIVGGFDSGIPCGTCGDSMIATSRTNLAEMERAARRGRIVKCVRCIRAMHDPARTAAWIKERDRRLADLRTMPYADYLRTPEWQDARRAALKRAAFACQLCNASGIELNVHHRTYERRGNEYARDLIVLCRPCHARFHEVMP